MPTWLLSLDRFFPIRYITWIACAVVMLLGAFTQVVVHTGGVWAVLGLVGVITGIRDVRQRRHSILRNYPVIGHLRFLFEFIRPEMRQYFIEGDNEAAPFSRQQRSLVYQRAKGDPDKRPLGTQLDVQAEGYEWINHSLQPTRIASHDFRVRIGGASCTQPYDASIFNISAMSFGALSGAAIRALNGGALRGNFAHDTGEGSISVHHRAQGGDLVWEVASGYFGCRNPDGTFNPELFAQHATEPQVKMIEIKLSQGAKPGHGGVLPGPKVTREIADARGVEIGVDCISPASHSAFSTPIGMLEFIAKLRELSGGKPVGFKFCVGHPWEWFGIAKAMLETGLLPDFIVVDGGEGGTGAAPLEFTDHVGAPLQEGLLLVHNTLVGLNLRDKIKIGCAGKVVSAFDIARMMALGADWCNSARGFMFALGCIQSQSCHTDHCPTGVATQDPQRQKALVVPSKIERVHNYHRLTLEALKELVQATGLQHPNQITANHVVRRVAGDKVKLLANHLEFIAPGTLLAAARGECEWPHNVYKVYWPIARADSFAPAAAEVCPEGLKVPLPTVSDSAAVDLAI